MERFFANPLFAWVAVGLLLLPVLIHLLNRRRHREVPWAAMRFLLAANRKSVRRMRLEQWLLLALRTAAIVLLPLAMARPILESALASGLLESNRQHIVILDPSLSMAAPLQRSAGSVFEHHIARAAELVEGFPEGEPITLISSGHPARRLSLRPVENRARARQLLDALEQEQTHNDLAGALLLVQEVLDAAQGTPDDFRLHVFSDFTPAVFENIPVRDSTLPARPPVAELMRSITQRCRVALYQVGGTVPANLSLSSVRLGSPLLGTRRLTQVQVTVHNHGTTRSPDTALQLQLDARTSVELKVPALSPGGHQQVQTAIELDSVGLHAIEALLQGAEADALPADDHRRLVVRAREHIPVLLVDGKPGADPLDGHTGYVATALAPRTRLSEAPFIETTVISENELEATQLERFDVLMLCDVRRLPAAHWRQIERFVRRGGGLLLFLGDLVDTQHYNQEAAALLPANLLQPAFPLRSDEQFTRLDPTAVGPALAAVFGGRKNSGVFRARIHQYIRLSGRELPAGVPLLSYENGDVAVAERTLGAGRCVVCTTTANMDWNNLPAKGDFVTLCMNLLRRVAPFGAADRNVLSGSNLVIRAQGASAFAASGGRLRLPSGRVLSPEVRAVPRGFELDFGRVPQSGWYTLESTRDEGPVAVNVHPAESDLRRLAEPEIRERLQCEFELLEVSASSGHIATPESGRTTIAMLFAVPLLLLFESGAALAFGHHRR